jgi:hypothetical protein
MGWNKANRTRPQFVKAALPLFVLTNLAAPSFIEKPFRGVAAFSTSPESRFFRLLGEVFGMLTA